MMSITDQNMSDRFASAMEEIHTNQLKSFSDIIDMTTAFSQSHKQFVKSAHDSCLKKCKDDEILFETIQAFKKDLHQKKALQQDKERAVSKEISEIQAKEMHKDDIMKKIEKLQEEQIKRKELVESQNKANKMRLRNLQKARLVFQDHLGLEIRTILGHSEIARGEKLQFIFRNINPADEDSVYVVTMGLNEDRQYYIVSSDPELQCLPYLESQLQETNNLAAFLANVRKEFISRAR